MVGNNSAGARSLLYGKTVDNIIEVKAILADGSEAVFGPVRREDLASKTSGDGLESEIYRTALALAEEHRERDRPPVSADSSPGQWVQPGRASRSRRDQSGQAHRGIRRDLGHRRRGQARTRASPRGDRPGRPTCRRAHGRLSRSPPRCSKPVPPRWSSSTTWCSIWPANRSDTRDGSHFIQGDPHDLILVEFYGESGRRSAPSSKRSSRVLAARFRRSSA